MKQPYITSTWLPEPTPRQQDTGNELAMPAITQKSHDFRVNHQMVHDTASVSSNLASMQVTHFTPDAVGAALSGLRRQTYTSSLLEPLAFHFGLKPSKPKNQ